MLTKAERKMLIKFQDQLGELIDEYLKLGMSPNQIREVMNDEMDKGGMEERRAELNAKPYGIEP